MDILEAVSNGIKTIFYWVNTAWKSIPDELKPSIGGGAVIGIILSIIFTVLKVKKK